MGDEIRAEHAALWAQRLSEAAMPEEEQAELQAWLDADPRNGQTLEEIVAAWQAVENYAVAPEIMALREEALAVARRAAVPPPVRFGQRHVLALIAATLLLIFSGLGLWYANRPDIYRTGLGERQVVMLEDGSKLSLDASTLVRVKYGRDSRRLWLERGRAKFDVAKDPLRPFSVAAHGKLVVATGTAFSVELIGNEVRVALYEGKVAVLQDGPGGTPTPILDRRARAPVERQLTVGRELVLAASPAGEETMPETAVKPIDPVRSVSWEGGMLDFDNETLAVVTARTNRHATLPVILDPQVEQLRISGVFRAGDTQALVEGLAATLHLSARQEGHSVRLSLARQAARPTQAGKKKS